MNKATLKICAITFLIADLWIHYFLHEIFNPNSYVIGLSMLIVGVGIIKSYYDLKEEL